MTELRESTQPSRHPPSRAIIKSPETISTRLEFSPVRGVVPDQLLSDDGTSPARWPGWKITKRRVQKFKDASEIEITRDPISRTKYRTLGRNSEELEEKTSLNSDDHDQGSRQIARMHGISQKRYTMFLVSFHPSRKFFDGICLTLTFVSPEC